MADVNLTTEQLVKYDLSYKDGRGRTVAVEGTPTVNVSNPAVASAAIEVGTAPNTWVVTLTALTPTTQDETITVDADADLGAGVQDVINTGTFAITLDPRTGARIGALTAGAPEDKPVA